MLTRSLTTLAALAALTAGGANATVVTVFSDDFTGFTGSGFAPTPAAGQLDSDTYRVTGFSDGAGSFGGTHTSGDFARGNSSGGVSSGGVYAFDLGGGNTAVGFQPGGSDITPGTFEVQFTYTGVGLTTLEIDFDIAFYNDQDRANSFELTSIDVAGTEVLGASVGLTSPGTADGSPAWNISSQSTGSIVAAVNNGDVVTLVFTSDDVSGGGSRDEIAIDNIEVAGALTPEPGSLALLGLGGLMIARRRRG
ncbi:MAG: PEP-CTERM sorting domain-containing protein [Phycisphaerales bacterium JB063]